MELPPSEHSRRYTLVRKWDERAYEFLEKAVQRHGVPTLEALSEHPRFSSILTEAMGSLLDRHWNWYVVMKLRVRGFSYEAIVAELPEILWEQGISRLGVSYEDFMTKVDIFWKRQKRHTEGGENGEPST